MTTFHIYKISRWILLKIRNVLEKNCRGNQNTHFIFTDVFPENRAIYKIMSKNMVETESPRITIWSMSFAYCISKATRAHAHAQRPGTHKRAHTHGCNQARARTHTHRQKYAIVFLFSTTTMLSLTLLTVMLYLHCLPWLFQYRVHKSPSLDSRPDLRNILRNFGKNSFCLWAMLYSSVHKYFLWF